MDTFHRVLEGKLSKHSELLAAHAALSKNPRQIGDFLDRETNRLEFQTQFETYGQRLIDLVAFCYKHAEDKGRRSTTKRIARELLELTVCLLDEEFDSFVTADVLDQIITSVLALNVLHQHPGLKSLVGRVSEKCDMLERLVSDEKGSRVLQELYAADVINRIPAIGEIWARKLIGLCRLCPAHPQCHGITSIVERWYALDKLIEILDEAKQKNQSELSSAYQKDTRTASCSLSVRKLDRDDKKSDAGVTSLSSRPTTAFPTFSEPIIRLFHEFDLQAPKSARTADVLLEKIRTEYIPDVVRTALGTFPCKPCHELANDPKALLERQKTSSLLSTDSASLGFKKAVVENPLFGEKIGLWKVLLSAEALKDVQRQISGGNISLLETRLRKLASGDWKGGKFSAQLGTPSQKRYLMSPLLGADAGKQLRILWQIDVGYCEDGVYRQHVKIWRVTDRRDVPKAVEHVVMVQRSQLSRSECDEFPRQPVADSSGIFLPAEYHKAVKKGSALEGHAVVHDASTLISIKDRRAIELYNKFYEFTKPVMKCFLAGNLTAEFPFDTSPEEIEVIKHDNTGTLIMGRSGTGKTTCLVQKLVRNYVAPRSMLGQVHARQVLITRSKFLAEKLKTYTRRLVESQLSNTAAVIPSEHDPHDLTLGEENEMFSKTLVTLGDDEFPLVCTFDQLLRLLENTVEYADRQKFHSSLGGVASQKRGEYVRRAQVVDYTLFRSEYWRLFPSYLTKHHEAGLVFSEFMGIIKGFASSERDLGTLSRNEYLSISPKRAPTFSPEQRAQVYDLFELYEKQKSRYGDKDGIDRVMALVRFLRGNQDAKQMIENLLEELYVDEVQDHRCVDIVLLLKLVKNPRGIHLAGDTAQCISKDSTFRFADVKALFYEQFFSLASATSERTLAFPVMFKLNRNFRSHQGIISLASFVMNLLYTGFPQTVDKMDEERGQYSGPIPTVFVGLGTSTLASRIVGVDDAFKNAPDFGAEQVIIVRDDAMKKKVQDQIGDIALVLTILDSKGMEFDDVFLLDFFTGTPCASSIRALETILTPGGSRAEVEGNGLLCSELKHLYVAVTRPRNQLLIFESSVEAAQPILRLLSYNRNRANPLVEVVSKDDPNINEKLKLLKPAANSDPKRFSEMGYQLLQRHLFREALQYFKKAGDDRGMSAAHAHLYIEKGRGHRAENSPEQFMQCFGEAVRLFQEADQSANSAFCLEEMGRLEEAADVYATMGRDRKEQAASLYYRAGVYRKASDCYDAVERYDTAAAALRKGELFGELVQYVEANRDRLDPAQTTRYHKLCMILLKQGRISADLQEVIIDALGSDDEKEDFFRKCKLTKQLVAVFVKRGKYGEAFRELVKDGKLEKALKIGLTHMHATAGISESDIVKLIDYTEYKRVILGYSSSGDASTVLSRLDVPSTASHGVKETMKDWWAIEECIHKDYNDLHFMCNNTLKGLHQDILSLHVVLYQWDPLFDKATSITDLTDIAACLKRTVKIWRTLRNDDQELPVPIAIVLGAFTTTVGAGPFLLQRSILRNQKAPESQSILRRSWGFLVERMLPLYIRLDDIARRFWRPQQGVPCGRFIFHGTCNGTYCFKQHKFSDVEECQMRVRELELMSSLLCSFETVYYNTGRNSDDIAGLSTFRKEYRGRRRRWLENLLNETIFRSPVEHDHNSALRNIAEDKGALFRGLESLLFYRLDKRTEWEFRNDLSALLEQFELSENLGRRVAARFRAYVEREGARSVPISKRVETIRWLRRAVWGAKIGRSRDFSLFLKKGLGILRTLEPEDFTSFHSIVGMFERLATFLFVMICPLGCVLPASWLGMHLPEMIISLQQLKIQDDDRIIYGQCLIMLFEVFLELVTYLDRFQEFNFTYGLKRGAQPGRSVKAPSFEDGMRDRNRNFIVIGLINLATLNVPLRGSGAILQQAQNAFTLSEHSLLSRDYQGLFPKDMSAELFRSYSRYNGKDSLTILTRTAKPAKYAADILSTLNKYGIPTAILQDILKSHRPDPSELTASVEGPETTEEAVTDEAFTAAAKRIQSFWRKRHRYLLSRSRALRTSEGEIIEFIFATFVRRKDAQPQIYDKIRKNHILVTQGVDFYLQLRLVHERCKKAELLFDKMLGDVSIQAEALDELVGSSLMVELEDLRALFAPGGKLSQKAGDKEVGKLYVDPMTGAASLGIVFRRVGRSLADVEKRLQGIVERLQKIEGSLR